MSNTRPDSSTLIQGLTGPAGPLVLIAGPCVLESSDLNNRIAERMKAICESLGITYVFKASFDKANRSSITSPRGPGLDEGLRLLESIKNEHDLPLCTDIHEPSQAAAVGEGVDILQIPAFLCRQTDLLVEAGRTDCLVNVKKGQFMAAIEMKNVVKKLEEAGASGIMLTERGTFFGYHRLVNDFIGVGDMMDLGCPVCFDITHSTQLPGGTGTMSGGRKERCELLARAAVAIGIPCLFMECHPDPDNAASDKNTVMPLDGMESILASLVTIRNTILGLPQLQPGDNHAD
ncbi:MAG: 3-deoxy-8-phosphooctulonate synthase [Phycisphaerae bacterium]|nr:3-deoxy-8-phosphooctulonate synthase [Phycisphaerae bacterium]